MQNKTPIPLPSIIKQNISLKEFNTYKIGGNAKYFSSPHSTKELITLINYANKFKIPYDIIGAGSNVIISDEDYDGLIILLNKFNQYIIKSDNKIIVGAGVKLSDLIQYSINASLAGVEKLSGIPGLIGGGVMMNAGAYGIEFKDFIVSVRAIDSLGNIKEFNFDDIQFGYRSATGLENHIILEATIKLTYSDKTALSDTRNEILKSRSNSQPLDKPSCGSVFKRPTSGYAGDLIEKTNLKGYQYKTVMVSDKHANFIVPTQKNIHAADIVELINIVKTKVYNQFAIQLEQEVKLIGFKDKF